MIYKKLTPVETNMWIRLLEDTIAKAEELQKYWDDLEKDIRQKYKEQYTSKWYWRLWHNGADPDEIHVSYGGRILRFGSMSPFSFCHLREITYIDMLVRDFTWEWTDVHGQRKSELYKNLTHSKKLRDMYNALHRSWSEFANRPFEIEERDLGHYLDIEATNTRLSKLLDRLKEQNS